MSIEYCHGCDGHIDTDYDVDHLPCTTNEEYGPMPLHTDLQKLCATPARDLGDALDTGDEQQRQAAAGLLRKAGAYDMLREALVDVKQEIDKLGLSIATSVYFQMRDVIQRTEEA